MAVYGMRVGVYGSEGGFIRRVRVALYEGWGDCVRRGKVSVYWGEAGRVLG